MCPSRVMVLSEVACCASRWFSVVGSVYRILKSYDLISSPAYVVLSAADEFRDKTTRPNKLWQTDFTYLKCLTSAHVGQI